MSSPDPIQEAKRILLQKYDSFVIVARATDDNNKSGIDMNWHGHWSEMHGLVRLGQIRLEEMERRIANQIIDQQRDKI